MGSRGAKILVAVAIAAAVPLGLWAVSQASVSPEQRIADAEPPPPPTVEVALEERVLRDTVAFRGIVAAVADQAIAAPQTGESAAVVIDLPVAPGDRLDAGDLVAVVADRPVLILQMPVPLHRSLEPTDEGPDVERLQAALDALGHGPFDGEAGVFGPATQDAVRALYADGGFPAPTTGPQADEALDAAETQRASASDTVEDAERDRDRQRTALARQQEALADARDARDDLAETDDEGDETADDAALEAADEAVRAAETAVADALDAVAAAERALDRAISSRDAADDAVAAAAARVGVRAPAGEIVGVPALPVVVSSVTARVGEVAEGPLLTYTPADLVVEATVESSLAGLLAPGVRAVIGEDEQPAEVVDNQGRADDGRPQVILRPDTPLPPDALGLDLRVLAELAATDGPVLAAPVTAIRSGPDGEFVEMVGPDDETRRVEVRTGASIGGWVEITGADDAAVGPGTLVRAG